MTRKALLLIVLLVTDIVLFGAIVRYFPLPRDIDLQSKMMSAILAHWFLLGFWLSFGGMKAPLRQIIFTAVLAIVCAFAAPLDGVPNMAAIRSLLILAVTWFFYAAMFFPRRLLGLRIGFSGVDRPRKTNRQFGLGVLLGFMVVASIPLGLSRLAFAIDSQLARQALFELAFVFGPTCATVLPFAIAIFATRQRWLKLSLSLGWCVLATFAVKHFHPPTAGGQVLWEAVVVILGLVWVQVTVNLLVARLLGLRWLGARESENASDQIQKVNWRRDLQWAAIQMFSLAVAIVGGLLAIFAPNDLQFVVAYVLTAFAPALILAVQLWRRSRPNGFWAGFLVAGFFPWCYAMFAGTQEAWSLLWGTPTFASTSPVEVRPTSGLDWSEVLTILIAPLVIGALGGVVVLTGQRALLWYRHQNGAQLASAKGAAQ